MALRPSASAAGLVPPLAAVALLLAPTKIALMLEQSVAVVAQLLLPKIAASVLSSRLAFVLAMALALTSRTQQWSQQELLNLLAD